MRFNVEINKHTLKWESCKEQLQSRVTNFQCGNFASWKKDQIMIHTLCLRRHSYEKTLFVKICNTQSTFFPNLGTFDYF